MWCSMCGADVQAPVTECEACAKWWADNPPPRVDIDGPEAVHERHSDDRSPVSHNADYGN